MTRYALSAIFAGIASLATAAPPDLAMVPPDAIAVVHIRGKDLWKSDLLTGLRTSIEKAGTKAVAAFDDGFIPRPSTLNRLTIAVLPPVDGPPVATGILAFDAAFDAAKVREVYCKPEGIKLAGGKAIYELKDGGAALHFPDDRHIVISDPSMLRQFLTHKPGKANPTVAAAIERAAAGQATILAAVDLAIVPSGQRRIPNVPLFAETLLQAQSVTLALETAPGQTKFAFSARYKDADAAADAEKAAKQLMVMAGGEMAKMKPELEAVLFGTAEKKVTSPRPLNDLPAAGGALMGLGFLNQMDEWIKNPPFTRKDDRLVIDVTVPNEVITTVGYYSMSLGLLLPAVQKVREAAARTNGMNNLKQIGIALYNYHDSLGTFPIQAPNLDGKGPNDPKKRLSWRVHILPYLEHDNLYKQFKLDEPWDSEHNKKLIPLMPKTYVDSRMEAGEGKTYYKGIAGTEAIFHSTNPRRIQSISDGTSNTIMVIAAGDPVVWTAPDDVEFDPKKKLPDLSKPFGAKTNCLFADGAVRSLDFTTIKPEWIIALFTAAGGEVIPRGVLDGDIHRPGFEERRAIPVPPNPPIRRAIPTKK